jgi:hypothetical protein
MPFSTFLTPFAESSEQNSSYNLFASSGAAESVKDGLLPFLQSAQRVNCEIARISPPTSLTLRFIFPFSSSNTRKRAILPASNIACSSVSPSTTPSRTLKPLPISPTVFPSTETFDDVTR